MNKPKINRNKQFPHSQSAVTAAKLLALSINASDILQRLRSKSATVFAAPPSKTFLKGNSFEPLMGGTENSTAILAMTQCDSEQQQWLEVTGSGFPYIVLVIRLLYGCRARSRAGQITLDSLLQAAQSSDRRSLDGG